MELADEEYDTRVFELVCPRVTMLCQGAENLFVHCQRYDEELSLIDVRERSS